MSKMKGIVLSEAELRSALVGTLDTITLPATTSWQRVKPGHTLYVKESWNDVHPLGVQEGRYSQPGRGGIPGPPPVPYLTVYRIDGPTLRTWSSRAIQHPYRSLTPPTDCHCGGSCQYPMVCSDHHLDGGKRQFWYPARECPEWAARLFLKVTAVDSRSLAAAVQVAA